jgi:transposase
MKRFVEGVDRGQNTLLAECLEDWIIEDNPVRVIDVFVDELNLGDLGFGGVDPEATGRPSYHLSVLLKLYIYRYLNRVPSSRRLEREAGRNIEVMWIKLAGLFQITRQLPTPQGQWQGHPPGLHPLCRSLPSDGLLATAIVAIDGSKFKAVNNRDKNFTRGKVEWRRAQIEESVARYLSELDTADRHEPTGALQRRRNV